MTFAIGFEGPAEELIRALKYRGRGSVAAELASLAADPAAQLMGRGIDLLVPIPLHAVRRRERGFNQAELIARELSALIGTPVSRDALVRHRATPTQTGLGREARLVNVEGAFRARSALVSGKRVLVLDDVVTTGATMLAAARALSAAGAQRVLCFAVAGRIAPAKRPTFRPESS